MKKKLLWCYLDISNPIVAWEVAIGRISSVENAFTLTKEYRRSLLSIWQFSRLKITYELQQWQPFVKEMRIEIIRHHEFNKNVSRMRGCYFFESRKMAISVVNSFKWGKKFNENCLTEVEFYYEDDGLSIYDSAWIEEDMSDDDIRSYLGGETKYESPATEIICYGRGLVLNKDLIHKARELILEKFPNSENILHSAVIIFEKYFKFSLESNSLHTLWDAYHVGQVFPFFKTYDQSKAEVTFIMSDSAFKKYGMLDIDAKVRMLDFRPFSFLIPMNDYMESILQVKINTLNL